jgi:hypothetical protein
MVVDLRIDLVCERRQRRAKYLVFILQKDTQVEHTGMQLESNSSAQHEHDNDLQ